MGVSMRPVPVRQSFRRRYHRASRPGEIPAACPSASRRFSSVRRQKPSRSQRRGDTTIGVSSTRKPPGPLQRAHQRHFLEQRRLGEAAGALERRATREQPLVAVDHADRAAPGDRALEQPLGRAALAAEAEAERARLGARRQRARDRGQRGRGARRHPRGRTTARRRAPRGRRDSAGCRAPAGSRGSARRRRSRAPASPRCRRRRRPAPRRRAAAARPAAAAGATAPHRRARSARRC